MSQQAQQQRKNSVNIVHSNLENVYNQITLCYKTSKQTIKTKTNVNYKHRT